MLQVVLPLLTGESSTMSVDTDPDLETVRRELHEGLMETVSFAGFCQMLAGSEFEEEADRLQAAAIALHAAAVHRLQVPRPRRSDED
jgi:hypothetical protein